jgi:hypothetical protein
MTARQEDRQERAERQDRQRDEQRDAEHREQRANADDDLDALRAHQSSPARDPKAAGSAGGQAHGDPVERPGPCAVSHAVRGSF